MQPLIFAHRGASGRYPENTLPAFQAALRHHADGIELDVQLTKDQQVVVIHDHFLDRATDGTGLVSHHTLAELRQLRVGNWLDERLHPTTIPTFEEVCAFVAYTPLLMLVELKNFLLPQPSLEEKVIELIKKYQLEHRVVISSFNYDSLLHVKQLAGDLRTGLLYIGRLRTPWEMALRFQADQLHAPQEEITASLVEETRRHGLTLYGWTINDVKGMKNLAKLQIDGIITNYPLRAYKQFSKMSKSNLR
ncbi:glycerophosphodiester phosphodiesterase [Brevibacillus fulvus]|uniref:Glycerophosphoryl diester phosphodiesterase n=1 Tax=Brevibacillus fulvus TaxID=1125967 RepID=A0A938XWS6_9BACL|nr:glycerophosphodiester phosphodiesterase [Brevibacillus fulvus]MBM7588419.1 glycerophosphoryl diester phosphodiesterase [Brevibacillus fulvus]